MTMLDIRLATGLERREFAKFFGFPLYTLINWELGKCRCPEYVIRLTEHCIGTHLRFAYLRCENCMNKDCSNAFRHGFNIDCKERQVALIDV